MVINVNTYGVLPGGPDNDRNWAAMMKIVRSGAVLQFGAGSYRFTMPIVIGDGKFSVSTIHGITLRGEGAGAGPSEIGMPPITEIVCPEIRFAGPIAECAIEALTLTGGGIDMGHSFRGRIERVNVWNPPTFGLRIAGIPASLPPGCAVNASANSIRDLRIQLSAEHSTGIILGQDSVVGEGTSQNRFERCTVIGNGSITSNVGLSLRFCDYNVFEMLQISYCRRAYVEIPFVGKDGRYPSNIIMRDPVLQDAQPIHWDARWNPLTSGLHLERFVREWDGGPAMLDKSYGPPFPKHSKIFGSDTTGRVYTL